MMRENFVKISLLQQREIEMKALGPVIRAFTAEFGEEKTYALVRKTMRELAFAAGREAAAQNGQGLDNFADKCASSWSAGGELEEELLERSADTLRFSVKRCDYAGVYRELGFGDLGEIVSCCRDSAFIKGFDPSIEFERTKTLMEGGDCCDFCYKRKKDK